MLPDGSVLGGVVLDKMVVVFGVEFTEAEDRSAAYHVVPAEYLVDPALPGLPSGLSFVQEQRWLAPPPVFGRGKPYKGFFCFFHAEVRVRVSLQELAEGSVPLLGRVLRGLSYRRLRSLSLF